MVGDRPGDDRPVVSTGCFVLLVEVARSGVPMGCLVLLVGVARPGVPVGCLF